MRIAKWHANSRASLLLSRWVISSRPVGPVLTGPRRYALIMYPRATAAPDVCAGGEVLLGLPQGSAGSRRDAASPVHAAATANERYQSRTVEPKVLHVKASRVRQPKQRTIFLCGDMLAEIIVEGMQEALWRVRLPVIALCAIASEAAVDPVCGDVVAFSRGGLKWSAIARLQHSPHQCLRQCYRVYLSSCIRFVPPGCKTCNVASRRVRSKYRVYRSVRSSLGDIGITPVPAGSAS